LRPIIILAIVAVLAATGCGGSSSSGARGKKEVAASFYPLAFAAEEVGGRRVSVDNLTPPGSEPHDLEVSPDDVQELRAADLVLLLGHGFQPQLEDAAGGGDRVLRLLDTPGLILRAGDDPHVWLDPLRYSLIVKRIGVALEARARARRFVERLRTLDSEYRRGLASCKRDEIVTSHESFAYLAGRYGLRQVAIMGLAPEAEPSPRDLERVIDIVAETRATTIFFEPLVSPRLAEAVARATGARTDVLDPIEGLTKEEASRGEDYFSMMRSNLEHLRRALGCR
jgi:zinc transport system substrate-binding protein